MSTETERRQDVRFRVRLKAEIMTESGPIEVQTEDVAERGVFLRTDDAMPLQSLVDLKLHLPTRDDPLDTRGMALHTITPTESDERCPGIAFLFYDLTGEAHDQWHAFLAWLAETHPETKNRSPEAAPVSLAPTGTADPVRRKSERIPSQVEVRFRSVEQLYKLYTKNISTGGMLIETDLEIPIGTKLTFQIVHPETGDTSALDGIVRRAVREPGIVGLGVEFDGLTDDRRSEFFSWILNLRATLKSKRRRKSVARGDSKLS